MKKRSHDNAARKKAQRFATLRQLRRTRPEFSEALERRVRRDHSKVCAARSRLGFRRLEAGQTLRRCRDEYVEIVRPAASTYNPRVASAIAVAFLLPLVLALCSNLLTLRPAGVALLRKHHAPSHAANRSLAMRTPPKQLEGKPTRPNSAPVRIAPTQASGTRPQPSESRAQPPVIPVRTSTGAAAQAPARTRASPASAPGRRVAVAPTAALKARPSPPPVTAERVLGFIMQALFGNHAATQPKKTPASQRALRAATHAPAQRRRLAAIQAPHAAARAPGQLPLPPRKLSPWKLSADGTWVAVVRAPQAIAPASFSASTGQLLPLERSPVQSDGASVTIGWSRPVTVTIASGSQSRSVQLPAPDDSIEALDAVARPIGPHLVSVGWTPLAAASRVSDYEVFRSTDEGERPVLVATLAQSKHSWRDAQVDAASRYRYSVVAQTDQESVQASSAVVQTPAELAAASPADIAGKGMFLYFSTLASDPRNFHRYNPEHVIAEAAHARIRVIQLRMARGSCTMAETGEAHAWLDRLVDAAARSNIKLIAWTVPRRVTSQDLGETLAAAEYTTPNGNGFIGLALDLESGENYMGGGTRARSDMVSYIRAVRQAVGPRYLIVATVASPRGGYSNGDYPYAGIARYADVLQPMEYWHYFDELDHHEYERGEVAGAAAAAVARTKALAGRDIPVDVAGQSVALGGSGAPSGQEIRWSMLAAKSVGAIGETFFDWAGTQPDAWAAIQAFDW